MKKRMECHCFAALVKNPICEVISIESIRLHL